MTIELKALDGEPDIMFEKFYFMVEERVPSRLKARRKQGGQRKPKLVGLKRRRPNPMYHQMESSL